MSSQSPSSILVVEDEGSIASFVSLYLNNAGYTVLAAADGLDAERLFARHGSKIDLVVSDVIMPVCGGPELMKRLHVHAPGLRVLYMSGYTEQSAAAKAKFSRDVPLVQKPFTSAEFLRSVRAVLDGEPQRRDLAVPITTIEAGPLS